MPPIRHPISNPTPHRQFVDDFANPHAWMLTASSLHDMAVMMHANRSNSPILSLADPSGALILQMRSTDRAAFLLGGFALENAIKAFLVYENPSWVSNGRLSRELKSHKLSKLQNKSYTIPYKNKYHRVINAFEQGLDSSFRYPCSVTLEECRALPAITPAIWDGYIILMRAYGKRLAKLFKAGWHGPHGSTSRWNVTGNFLGD